MTEQRAIALPAELPPIPHGSTVEKLIVGKLVTDFLAAGFALSVNDGEETTVKRSTDPAVIFPALASTDEDYLIVHPGNGTKHIGWVRLIWGNDHHIISDFNTKPEIEAIVDPICDWAETLR